MRTMTPAIDMFDSIPRQSGSRSRADPRLSHESYPPPPTLAVEFQNSATGRYRTVKPVHSMIPRRRLASRSSRNSALVGPAATLVDDGSPPTRVVETVRGKRYLSQFERQQIATLCVQGLGV